MSDEDLKQTFWPIYFSSFGNIPFPTFDVLQIDLRAIQFQLLCFAFEVFGFSLLLSSLEFVELKQGCTLFQTNLLPHLMSS